VDERPANPGAKSRPAQPATPKLTWKERTARAWRWTKLGATLALGGALGWVVANLQGEAKLQKLQSDYEQRLTTQRELAQPLEARVEALRARRSIHFALIALDQRNFGTAEREARDAGEGLAALGPSAPTYAEVAEQLQSFRPRVSDDTSEQRAHLLGLAKRFDELFDAKQE
jgi:hypothetical protein